VAEAEVRPPAITVVGPVAELRETLAWLEARPLHGETVAVTRARAQASELAARLRELGAEVVETPAIRIEPLPLEPPDLGAYSLLCFTSPNGVRLFFAALPTDARALAHARVAAIGPGTATALREHGIEPDVVPERFVAEGLLEALADERLDGRRVLIARAADARDVLPEGLRERGAIVDLLALYRTVSEPLAQAQTEALEAATYVTFTSSSTVRFLLEALREAGEASPAAALGSARLVSIGPVTSATLREHGLEPDVEAERHDIDGLIAALTADARARRVGTP
jgi:uroporphyrinogen III methyltransferase/synthase